MESRCPLNWPCMMERSSSAFSLIALLRLHFHPHPYSPSIPFSTSPLSSAASPTVFAATCHMAASVPRGVFQWNALWSVQECVEDAAQPIGHIHILLIILLPCSFFRFLFLCVFRLTSCSVTTFIRTLLIPICQIKYWAFIKEHIPFGYSKLFFRIWF